MQHSLSQIFLALVTPLMFSVALPAPAQTPVNGPYYAVPSWDQTFPAATRFIVLANFGGAAVLDRETGLVWEREPSPLLFKPQPDAGGIGGIHATEHCLTLDTGRRGWRLASATELSSLIDKSQQQQPALPMGHPFVLVGQQEFWTSSTYYDQPRTWRIVDIRFGGINNVTSLVSFTPRSVWCVRGVPVD